MHIYTKIDPEVKRTTLFIGSVIAAIGGLLLVFFGMKIPAGWGIPILGVSLILIAFGLVPYRHLCKVETNPDQLILEGETLVYLKRGKTYRFPLQQIGEVAYVQERRLYGLKMSVAGKRLFLPYFDREAFGTLQARLHDVVHFDEA